MISIILLSVFGIINLFAGFLKKNSVLLPMAFIFLLIVLGINALDWNGAVWTLPVHYANNMLTIDNFSVAFTGVMVLSALLIIPFSRRYVRLESDHLAEYYGLLLLSLVGATMMVTYENMLMLFIGIEILSISMYVLAGSEKHLLRSNEASLKYFLMGAFATGILLFGIALIYGATGHFDLTAISSVVSDSSITRSPMLTMGLLFVLIGISFKIGAAPFHFWTPDVYEGTPTLFTAFMSTVVKTAGIAAFFKLLYFSFEGLYSFWYPTMAAITVLTLIVGNIGAIAQTSIKRMLAYSSISHAGYLLIALIALNSRSENAILFYSLAYSVATISAFAVLKIVSDHRQHDESYDVLNGLARTNPLLAVCMTVSMLSLAGIPLTGGFFGKFFLFASALERDMLWLVIIAVIMSAIGIYYYFRPVIAMFMKTTDQPKVPVDGFSAFTLILLTIITFVLGILPGLVSNLLG
jgi:NADH-quinone oxidoreductase subunit N